MGLTLQFLLAWVFPGLALAAVFLLATRTARRPLKPRGWPMLIWCLSLPAWMALWFRILSLALGPVGDSNPLPVLLGFGIPSIVTTALCIVATRSALVAVAGIAATIGIAAASADPDGLSLIFALIFWHLLFDAALLTWGFLARAARFRLHYIHTCPKCGYDLQNLPDPVCPECGTPGYVGWREGPQSDSRP